MIESVRRLPKAPGVYRFRDSRGHTLYIGRAVDLRRRVASYWGDLRDRQHLAPMIERIVHVDALHCDSLHEAAWLERNLLQRALPAWNRAPSGGGESEVYIALKPQPRVVYQPTPYGPYLGGTQTRLALRGLRRIQPPLARVLNRNPAALRRLTNELVRRRDAAAKRLAFEAAARLQAELDAITWITAEQKVTQPTTGDGRVCGWAGGTLLRLDIDAGRVTTWRITTAASPRSDPTPPHWRAFAQRNAELAATLVRAE